MEQSEQHPEATSWVDSLKRFPRRHPYWTALLVLVVVIRAALPYVLRPVLEDQISALLTGRIEIEDVDLALLRGEAAVEGVRVFGAEDGEPPVAFRQLLANVSLVGFPFSEVVVENLHLLKPVVRVVREADGTLNLERLPAPPAEDEAAEEPVPPEGEAALEEDSGWPIGLTRLALQDATISFLDRTVPDFDPIEFHIDLLEIERTAYGGPIYGDEQGKITLVSELAGAPLKISADFDSQILKATSTGSFSAKSLDVGLGAPYAAQLLGWKDLRGTLDLDVDFAANQGKTRSPRVVAELRDFVIEVKGEEQPAVSWDALRVEIDEVDADELSVDVALVRLSNFAIRVRPAEEQPLVVLSKMDEQAAEEPAESDAADDAVAEPAEPGADADGVAEPTEPDGGADAEIEPVESEGASGAAAEPAEAEAVADAATGPDESDVATAPESEAEPEVEVEVAEQAKADPAVSADAEAAAEAEPEAAVEQVAAETADERPADAVQPAEGEGPASANEAPTEDADEAPPASQGEPKWRLAKLVIDGAHILVESPEKNLDVGLQVELAELSSEPGAKGTLDFSALVEGGSLAIAGALGIAPPHFDGTVKLTDLTLESVLPVVPAPQVEIVRAGTTRADLAVVFDMREQADAEADSDVVPVDATVSGKLGLAGLRVAGDNADEFSLDWDDLAIDIDGIDVRNGEPATGDATPPIRIKSIELVAPAFHGVRMEDGGIALPRQLGLGEETEAVHRDELAAKVAERQAEPPQDTPPIQLDRFRLTKGSVELTDRAVQPVTKPGLNKIRVALDNVRMPERRIEKLVFSAKGKRGGLLSAEGNLDGEATNIVFKIDKYKLRPYDPYAVTFSGYGIRRGALTVESEVKLLGADFDTNTNVVVHRFAVKNTENAHGFENEVGIPISLALALLKDTNGDIVLDVPVKGNADETDIGIGSIIGQQLRRIVINALASPLKLFGAGGDELGDMTAAEIPFAEGTETLSPEGRAQAEELAALLRERPDLALHLDVRNSLKDVRSLQEAVLLQELEAKESVEGESLTIKTYLEQRAAGEEAELPPYLEPLLDDLLSHRRPPEELIMALSQSRIDVVRNVMVGELGVGEQQILVDDKLHPGMVGGTPRVEAELGVVEEDEEELDEDELDDE